MEETITINNKEYKIPEFNFGALVRLEKLGINFNDVESQSFNFINGLVALTMGCSSLRAMEEIDGHISNGGSLEDFLPLIKAVGESDFFQKQTKKRKK